MRITTLNSRASTPGSRNPNAPLQINGPSPTLSFRPRSDSESIPSWPSPPQIHSLPDPSMPSFHRVERGDWCLLKSSPNGISGSEKRTQANNLTMPNFKRFVSRPPPFASNSTLAVFYPVHRFPLDGHRPHATCSVCFRWIFWKDSREKLVCFFGIGTRNPPRSRRWAR